MEFAYDAKTQDLIGQMEAFMDEVIYPAEPTARACAEHVGRAMVAKVADQPPERPIAQPHPFDIADRVGEARRGEEVGERPGLDPRMGPGGKGPAVRIRGVERFAQRRQALPTRDRAEQMPARRQARTRDPEQQRQFVAPVELAAAFELGGCISPGRAAAAVADAAARRLQADPGGDDLERLEPRYLRPPRGVPATVVEGR